VTLDLDWELLFALSDASEAPDWLEASIGEAWS
jgi:hypothetical protein